MFRLVSKGLLGNELFTSSSEPFKTIECVFLTVFTLLVPRPAKWCKLFVTRPIDVSRALAFTPELGRGSFDCEAGAKESSVRTVLVEVPENAAAGDSNGAMELLVLYSWVAHKDGGGDLRHKLFV
jgi:hypothetical protein